MAKYLIFRGRYPKPWGRDAASCSTSEHEDAECRKIVFMCDGYKNHGGLTDRMRGLLTTYHEARRRKVPFFISWTEPFELSDFLVPAGPCDWRIERSRIHYDYARSWPLIMDISSVHAKNIVKTLLFKHGLRDGRDVLVYSNMMHAKKNIAQLYHELFKPSARLQAAIDMHLADIGGPYHSFTFRFGNLFGDFSDIVGKPLGAEAAERLLNKNIVELRRLLDDLPHGYRALVTSDSLFFLERVQQADERIYVVKQRLMHVDFYKYERQQPCSDTWLKSFLDQQMIMRAERVWLLRTDDMYRSSFPQLAATLGEKEFVLHEF